jgi:hypothetical protein
MRRAPRQGNQPSLRHAAHVENLLNAMTTLLLDQTLPRSLGGLRIRKVDRAANRRYSADPRPAALDATRPEGGNRWN